VAGRLGSGVLFRAAPDNGSAKCQHARFPAHPPSGGGRTGEAAADLAWRSVPWAPAAVDADVIELTDRQATWEIEEMERSSGWDAGER